MTRSEKLMVPGIAFIAATTFAEGPGLVLVGVIGVSLWLAGLFVLDHERSDRW